MLSGVCGQIGLLHAQRHAVFSPQIASLQVVAGVRWKEIPVIKLAGHEAVNISFDDLSHEYRRMTYTVKHLEADWSESEGLFESDYLAGFASGLTIDDNEQSINTLQDYTHYSLQIPNDNCRLLMSGNYRVDIRDDNADSLLASVFFMVNEEKAPVTLSFTDNTDIDVRRSHQQVEMSVDYSALGATDPRRQLKGYVMQNGRWNNAVVLPEPQQLTQRQMIWTHCRDMIFDAGNEHHKFEILDIDRNSLNVESNIWDGGQWHTYLWPDENRPAYVYDEVEQGAFYLRNTDNVENDIASEYVVVHFILKSSPLPYRLFVNGLWTNDRFLPQYEMHYDAKQKHYEAAVTLKYGYYSYQYLMLREDDVVEGDVSESEYAGYNKVKPMIPPTEGSYYQTRNKYNALIYYKGNTDRADRLVGVY